MFSFTGRRIQTPLKIYELEEIAATAQFQISPIYRFWLELWNTDMAMNPNALNDSVKMERK